MEITVMIELAELANGIALINVIWWSVQLSLFQYMQSYYPTVSKSKESLIGSVSSASHT